MIGLIGWGAVAQRLGELMAGHAADRARIAAVAVRDCAVARPELPTDARLVDDPDDLADMKLDLVIEAAGRAAVPIWGEPALRLAGRFAVSSTSAFCDDAVFARLAAVAREVGGQIIIPPGALGGIEALRAASILPLTSVIHTIVKPPRAWRGTRAEDAFVPERIERRLEFFRGSAREVADLYPKNANVAVIAALAGVGLERTVVCLVADPSATRNSHTIKAHGAFGSLKLEIENEPLASNPKSSEMTALSLMRLVRNLSSDIAL